MTVSFWSSEFVPSSACSAGDPGAVLESNKELTPTYILSSLAPPRCCLPYENQTAERGICFPVREGDCDWTAGSRSEERRVGNESSILVLRVDASSGMSTSESGAVFESIQ